ncbi:Glucose/arabinose dehydrogenase, beta-propeller fold [Cnuella takakiae]|uniref:Glucose/arabinose dehydrogenase, beta-propeller fold n=1 Tax=Cnuella takakiae TaxID=1302690 RepID=A0A1M5I5D4_9BACT|nr:Crp/Fnr family transcriptional regulator [Cnuella takakiae]SHG23528.1 Glucose/arabinose dehydrogenase, beta-propeller fold [Cnuella takakiae]
MPYKRNTVKRKPSLRIFVLFLFAASLLFAACNKRSGKPRVLVFSKTNGWQHESIPAGVAAMQKLGTQDGFEVDTTTNAAYFTEDSLKKYAAVVFLSTTGDVLNNYQEAEFERFIQSGGGFVGIHAAADTEYDWGWYGRLVGGYFETHPGIRDSFPNVQPGSFAVVQKDGPGMKDMPAKFNHTDEFYSFKKMDSTVNVLLTVDEASFKGGYMNGNHPMAWYHDYDGGRAWYTNLGHTNESFSDPVVLKHISGGIKYAVGDNKELNFDKARTAKVPEEERFNKTMLAGGQFYEPTEMTVLPNLDILVAQRRGEILLYKNGDSAMKQAGFLNVYFKTLNTPGVNAEEGVLGLKADPNFSKNNYVYIYYSPADTSVNRLSRFKFVNDKLDMQSEQVVLQLYSQREICCHTGGSIAFDNEGLLYLSTGDNSTPFDEKGQQYVNHGYAPLNDAPGHEQYDARRTSGNANDLRGKILRIRVKEDGSYEIPEGNLYPKGTAGTRPEIYVQGNRNPYRISVDQKNGFLYWGEVGPDAAADSLDTRGPRGYDELNQARKAGFFGWPLFVGNNYPYHEYNYETGATGAAFDPNKPINNSRNNTGIKELPPVAPPFIWYPYAASKEFPQVATGGRNAMAGPVYYTSMFPKETRLPDYYDGKLLIYDWIRGWIKAVTMKENGDFDKMEPFMGNTKFNALIDMEVGPDGKLYLLEYGSGWFSKNPDAALSRIDYNSGNLAPKVAGIKVDRTSGALPLKVVATVDAKDPEQKELKYIWNLGNGQTKETSEPRLEHNFDKAGEYALSVTVQDKDGSKTQSETVPVFAGNAAPDINVTVTGNKTFYFPGKPVAYAVTYTDKEDGSQAAPDALLVSADYVEGTDKAGANMGHQVLTEAMMGKNLVQSLDCKACHKLEEKSVGPAYTAVSQKYQKDGGAVNHLVNKIIRGGAGVWGETAMPAHPNLKPTDARQIVAYILSLSGGSALNKSLPANGTVPATLGKPAKDNGMLVISASYTDKGSNGIRPLESHSGIALRSNTVGMGAVAKTQGFNLMDNGGNQLLIFPKGSGWFAFNNIDLSGIGSLDINLNWGKAPLYGYAFEVRLDAPDGKQIGSGALAGGLPTSATGGGAGIKVDIQPVTDNKMHTLYIVARSAKAGERHEPAVTSIRFNPR